jgi:hypothetical protein
MARPYIIKATRRVNGKKAAERLAGEWLALGINSTVYPGIDPKCKVNHTQPGFGGHIDQVCSECGGYIYV